MPMTYSSCMKDDEACYYTAGGASLSTVAGLERQMGQYTSLFGVQPSQLAPTLQWFSNDFVCVENQSAATYHNPYGCSTVHPPSGVPTPGYGHVQMLAARPGSSVPQFDNASGHMFFDYNGAIPPAPVEHRQVWVEGPVSTKLKYDWLKKGGYKGFGIWVAGAVGAVEQYWWGGGCNGNTSQKVCPQNMTLTEQFAREMWAPVPERADLLKSDDTHRIDPQQQPEADDIAHDRTHTCDVVIAGGSLASAAAAVAAGETSGTTRVCFLEITDWPGVRL